MVGKERSEESGNQVSKQGEEDGVLLSQKIQKTTKEEKEVK